MPITNVNQEPVNLQELLLVKSMPILSKMLGPKINGSNVNNYRVVDVEEINNETFVVIESTKNPLVDIDTATADQKVQRRIPYARHHIKNVFEHFFGVGPFPFVDIPDTLEKLNTWISEQGVDLVLDEDEVYFNSYQVTDTASVVQIGPKDTKDLKWKGMYHMPIRRILEDESGNPLSVVWDWNGETDDCNFIVTLADGGEWLNGTFYYRTLGSTEAYESRSYQAANGGEYISALTSDFGTQFQVYLEINTEAGPLTTEVMTVTSPYHLNNPVMNITDNQVFNLGGIDIYEIVVTLPAQYGDMTDNQWSLSGNIPTGMMLNITDALHAELIIDGVEPGTYNVSVYYKYNSFIKSTPIQVTVAESQGGPA